MVGSFAQLKTTTIGKAELDSTGCQKGSNKVELLESIAQRRLLRGFWIVGGDHRD
jgi:hypothetical protein